MSNGIELNGIEDLMKKITDMGRKGAAIENQALEKAAQPILEEAKTKAPVRSGKGKEGLKISKVKKKGSRKYILVGVQKGDNSDIFYMKFHEFGTSKMSAKPFLGPAYEGNKQKVINIIKDELRRGLGLK